MIATAVVGRGYISCVVVHISKGAAQDDSLLTRADRVERGDYRRYRTWSGSDRVQLSNSVGRATRALLDPLSRIAGPGRYRSRFGIVDNRRARLGRPA